MIVKELMAFLINNANPSDEIVIAKEIQAMGSSQTGMYGSGEMSLHKIKSIVFMKADTLAGLGELEQIDRVEISIEDDD